MVKLPDANANLVSFAIELHLGERSAILFRARAMAMRFAMSLQFKMPCITFQTSRTQRREVEWVWRSKLLWQQLFTSSSLLWFSGPNIYRCGWTERCETADISDVPRHVTFHSVRGKINAFPLPFERENAVNWRKRHKSNRHHVLFCGMRIDKLSLSGVRHQSAGCLNASLSFTNYLLLSTIQLIERTFCLLYFSIEIAYNNTEVPINRRNGIQVQNFVPR